jgi:hypothetical protein
MSKITDVITDRPVRLNTLDEDISIISKKLPTVVPTADAELLVYNDPSGTSGTPRVGRTTITDVLSSVTGVGDADYSSLTVVTATTLQEFVESVDNSLLKARGTGVSSTYVSTAALGGTTFAQPEVHGEINSDEGFYDITYAGATGITVSNLNSASTYVYVDNTGSLQQQTTEPTRQDWSRKMFTMRISVNTSTNLIQGFEYLNNPIGNDSNSLRDIYTYLIAQGVPFRIGQTITGRADLGFDVSSGSLLEFGGTGDINNANIKSFTSVTNSEYALMSRTAVVSSGNTDLVKFWDNAGVITALGSTTIVGHRLYRFSNGNFAMQYGQGNYANMALAKVGVLAEEYVKNPQLDNATFFGWWFIESTATDTSGTTLTDFKEYTLGMQGSSSALSGSLSLVQQTSAPTGDSTVLWFDTDEVASASPNIPASTETGTTYTLSTSDGFKIMSNAALVTVTIPLFSSVEFTDGDQLVVQSSGAGGVTLSVTSITLIGSSPNLTIAQNEALFLKCVDASADTWSVVGGTAT